LDTPFDSRLLSGLGVLAAVVEAGNFVRAAGVLGLTQSGVNGHHHPDYLSDAVEKIAMRTPAHERKAHVSGAVIPFSARKP
jgi:hypothetical protein